MRGCAQRCPARPHSPSTSSDVARTCECTSATLKLTTPLRPAASAVPYDVTPAPPRARPHARAPRSALDVNEQHVSVIAALDDSTTLLGRDSEVRTRFVRGTRPGALTVPRGAPVRDGDA